MAPAPHPIARALHLRQGEGHVLLVLGGYLLLCTAATTILGAAKNGLFLSVYPGRYIPHVVIAAAALTALVAILFTAVIAGTARRRLAAGLTAVLVAVTLLSRWAFAWDARMALAVYLLMSVVQVLTITHAWDLVGDLLTGRQAKRLAPLFGIGASFGALLGGGSVPLTAVALGTDNLLVISAALIALSLPLLWLVPEPEPPVDETSDVGRTALAGFMSGAGRGMRSIGREPLLRLMALSIVAMVLAGTLIELQFKLALQASFERDRITAILGILSSLVAVGTLVAQLVASGWLFPKLGVSLAGVLHGGLEALAAWSVLLFGGVWALAALQALDDILGFAVQKPVEQISLLPYPGPVKSAAMATLGGVVRPLSEAAAGGLAILLLPHGAVVPVLTASALSVGLVLMLRHRRLYLAALERALSRHSVDFSAPTDVQLVVDRSALSVIDGGLSDEDPTVVVFSLSLLEQLPPEQALPRALPLLGHAVAEVRAEAAQVLARVDMDEEERPVEAVRARLGGEESPFVQASLLATLGEWGAAEEAGLEPFLGAADAQVRAAAFVALGRSAREHAGERRLRGLLSPSAPAADRLVGAQAAGALGAVELLPELAAAVEDDAVRPAALEAMASLGAPAVPVLRTLLGRRDLPLPIRRSLVTALASVAHRDARDALIDLVDEAALGPAALTSLQRMRREHRIDPVASARLQAALRREIAAGLRYALVSSALRECADGERSAFAAEELEGLGARSVYRVMRILTLSHDPGRMDIVQAGLASADASAHSNALELLEGTLSPEESRLVIPFAEAAAERFAPARVTPLVPSAEALRAAPLEALLGDDDWWTRALALHALGRDDEITIPGRDPGQAREEPDMIPLIERVMILKGSQLFRYFPGNDLAGIASLAEVVHLQADDVVFEQGEAGDAFYMVVRGGVRIMRGSVELALLGPREGFGEMAILDQETRSATATAAEATTLLRIDRDSFDRLIEQNPSVARGIYRMLTQRLRNTLAQVAAG